MINWAVILYQYAFKSYSCYIDVSTQTVYLYIYSYVQYFMTCSYDCNFTKKLHTLLYHTMYHCIVIQKWQYIDTPKLCIVILLIRMYCLEKICLLS